MEQKVNLLKKYIESIAQDDIDRKILLSVGTSLSGHFEDHKKLYMYFLDGKKEYEYIPKIGASIKYEFIGESVNIETFGQKITLKKDDFIDFLAVIDLLFADILPLGSIIELDTDLIEKDLVDKFNKNDMNFNIFISGRRVKVDDKNYIDYIGQIWPFGIEVDVNPIFLNKIFIKRVISKAYTDKVDLDYCDKNLREDYFYNKIFSSIYKKGDLNEDKPK